MMLRHFSLVLVCLGSFACAETAQQSAQQDNAAQSAMRNRPRRTAARRALRDAAAQARECLPLNVERADVAGSFVGTTGRYAVESVLGENIGREQRECIRAAFEGARVLPFRAARYEMSEVVSRASASDGATSSGGEAPVTAGAADAGAQPTVTADAGTAATASATTATTATTPPSDAGATSVTGASSGASTVATNSSGAASATSASTTASEPNGASAGAGSIEQNAVANIMRTRTNVVRACYQNQLAREPLLRARVRVRFTIDAAGLVTQASSTAVAEAGDPDRVSDLARCVEGIIRGTTFPARAGASPAEVSMPFVFSPGAPSATVASASNAGSSAPAAAIATPGTLDRERVAATIRARMPQLSQCYARASQQDPQLAGRVTVRFVVNPDGRVADVQSTPTTQAGVPTHMTDVARCVQSAFFGFVFSPPTGGAAAAVLPLDFGPTS